MRMVLETLRHHKLYAKESKCQFIRSSVGFLGHVISERGVAVDPRKVTAVADSTLSGPRLPRAPTSAASSVSPTIIVSLCCASLPWPPR